MRRVTASALALLLLASSACSNAPAGEGRQTPWPDDVARQGPIEEPNLPPETQPAMAYHGRYEVSTYLDIAGSGVLGEKISGTLVALSEFHENPAGTILDLLALYDTPYFSVVWDYLPGFLKDYVEEWLNDYVFDAIFDGVPVIEQVVQAIDDIATVSRNVELVTQLTLWPPDTAGRMAGHHQMTGIAFTLWDNRALIPLPDLITSFIDADPYGTLTVMNSPNPAMPEGLLNVDNHTFGLPFGDMILEAINQLVFQPLGYANLREWLGALINCAGVGQWMADRCVAGACVGDFVSEAELEGMCNEGLDLLADAVEAPILALNIDVLQMDNGRCKMFDVGYEDTLGDYQIDALADGQWDTSMSFFGQTFRVDSYFEGRRIRD